MLSIIFHTVIDKIAGEAGFDVVHRQFFDHDDKLAESFCVGVHHFQTDFGVFHDEADEIIFGDAEEGAGGQCLAVGRVGFFVENRGFSDNVASILDGEGVFLTVRRNLEYLQFSFDNVEKCCGRFTFGEKQIVLPQFFQGGKR